MAEIRTTQQFNKGFDAWFNHYSEIFGSRWENSLYPAMLKKSRPIAFVNPFFHRFEIKPKYFHPRAQWCTDSELHGCMYVPSYVFLFIQNLSFFPFISTNQISKFLFSFNIDTVSNSDSDASSKMDQDTNLLHPVMLRLKKGVEAWLREEEFEKSDAMWYGMQPHDHCTYYEYFEKLPEFSSKLQHLKLYKLSWRDLDPYYMMDAASIRIARLVDMEEGTDFLDMCSAPGGKSLVMMDQMLQNQSRGVLCKLVSNEMGFKRTKTLKHVLESFIPENVRTKHLSVTNVDAKLWGMAEPNKYDGILLDAPCSGDRHLLHQKEEISKWSMKSCKNLQKTQHALLRSALETVRIGGYVVYATCSINPIENDQLVEQVVRKQKSKVQVQKIEMNVGERTEFGWSILPDVSPLNEGPLYVAKLRRIG